MDRETQAAIGKLAAELGRIDEQVRRQGRAQRRPQLAHSSLEEGQVLEARGPGGRRQRWGWIDGAIGTATEGGDPVSAPTAPTVTPSLGGLRVTWDGELANGLARPVDLDHLDVHVSTSAGFTPSAATRVGSIRREGEGGMLPVVGLPYEEHYVVFVPVTTGGIQGDPSAEVAATPLQVDGPDLVAASVDTAHLKAEAVTASKLEAILVLVSTIIGGIPGAARVEVDQDGLRGYNDADELIFAIDTTSGNAVFSGDIMGSVITGSTIEIGEDVAGSNYGAIEETDSGMVRARMTSDSGARAQLAATSGQAEFSAWGSNQADTPAAGLRADPTSAQLLLWSDESLAQDAPYAAMLASSGQAQSQWQSPTGSRVRIVARDDYTALFSTPPESATEPDTDGDGAVYAFRTSADAPATTVQSPVVNTGPGAGMRSMLHLAGTTSTRDYARADINARRIVIGPEWDQINEELTDDPGSLQLQDTHSILADRHAPQVTYMLAQPTATGTGDFVDFTEGEFPSLPFTAPWSGRVEIAINMCGYNFGSTNGTLSTGFRLEGPTTLSASLHRSAMVRSPMSDVAARGAAGRTASVTLPPLQLDGNATYTLIPAWRTSTSYDWSRTDSNGDVSQAYDLNYQNSIIVKPLM